MKKVLFGIILMVTMGTANAVPPAAPVFAITYGYALIAMNDTDIPTCYHEPIRLVKWIDQPGYSFEVAGCDYQAKKDRLVVIK